MAQSIVLEQGKTLPGSCDTSLWRSTRMLISFVIDAHGDILRGLQVVEHAASAPSLLLGEKIEGELSLTSALTYVNS